MRTDLTHLANHQSCEGVGHHRHLVRNQAARDGLETYHGEACAQNQMPGRTTALMSTAANMQCAVLASAQQEELKVSVAATAGVLGNATRAGDPAGWHEHRQGSRPIERQRTLQPTGPQPMQHAEGLGRPSNTDLAIGAQPIPKQPAATPESAAAESKAPLAPPDERGAGTIVTLIFINQPCTPACLARAVTMVTEAKSTALLDLRMPSLQSAGLATGTGTDQFALAAPLPQHPDDWERNWAGSHNSLGELLAKATREAVTRCLLLQNGVCAELRRSVCAALGRHGCDTEALHAQADAALAPADAELFAKNLTALIHDPQTAAAAYALAEIIDLTQAGILHDQIAEEALINQASLLAAAVAVAPEQFAALREALMAHRNLAPGLLAARAVALGFACKWR